jgi:hypothetical protein
MEPHPELVAILLRAYEPCAAFVGPCHRMRWNPTQGHVPRGFCGATGRLEDVELVLVCAEPGDPHDQESHAPSGCALDRLRSAHEYAYDCFKNSKDLFHRNIRYILDSCFPKLSFDDQMQHTWITDSVLCSAERECGSVPAAVGRECRSRYLDQQLKLFPRATVVALGRKAATRLAGAPGLVIVDAAAPPRGANPRAKESWQKIVARLQERRGQAEDGAAPGTSAGGDAAVT